MAAGHSTTTTKMRPSTPHEAPLSESWILLDQEGVSKPKG